MSDAVQNPPANMPRITPGVYYNDSAAGLAFLENAFGFKARCKYPGPDGQIMHSELELADGLIFVGTACEENRSSPANLNGQTTIGLYIYVDDVDAHCETARAAGAEITAEPADQFYGDRHILRRPPLHRPRSRRPSLDLRPAHPRCLRGGMPRSDEANGRRRISRY